MVLLGPDGSEYGEVIAHDDGHGNITILEAPDKTWVSEELCQRADLRWFLLEGNPAREGALLTMGSPHSQVRYISQGKHSPHMRAFGFIREFLWTD